MAKHTNYKKNRKLWFKSLKVVLKLFTKKPKFVYLGEEPIKQGSVMLCNHAGAYGPLKLEFYFNHAFRFWGAHQMNEGLVGVYKYLSTIYYQQKHHYKPFFAKLMALIACPIVNIVYKGLRLISTYNDGRFIITIRKSVASIKDGESIIIFPEDSSNGYFNKLTMFHSGFVALLNKCYSQGQDLPIYVMYYQKQKNRYIIDEPIMYSTLVSKGLSRQQIAENLKNRCNELAYWEQPNKEKCLLYES